MNKRLGSLLLAAALMSGMLPAHAVELTVEDTGSGSAAAQSAADWDDVSRLVAAYEDDSFYGEITIDPQTDEVQKDQEDISLKQEMELTRQEEREILQSSEAAEEYFDEQDSFAAYTDDDGVVHVTQPYQTARLIVFADALDSDYGAEEVLHLEQYDEYILQFAQPEDAQTACERLRAALGEENCFPDEMKTADMLLSDEEETADEVTYSWGTEYMGLDQLKQQMETYQLSSRTATVAIIDTGIDSSNVIFEGRTITGYNFVSSSRQEVYNNTDPEDCVYLDTSDYYDYGDTNEGHGTHVAGIVADATSDNVTIMMLRIFDAGGYSYSSLVISALQYADEQDVDVVNMSLGEPDEGQTTYDSVIKQLYRDGIPVVAAAGNRETQKDGTYNISVTYPATMSKTIAVSWMNQDGSVSSSSCYGSEVDFTAPGTSVVSAGRNGAFSVKSGTSMAAPHVTAAVAMIALAHPEYTVRQIKNVLIAYAVDLETAGKDEKSGYGVVQLGDYYTDELGGYRLDTGTWALELKYTRMGYTGKARKNPVTLVNQNTGETLDASCYTVSYENNVNVGTATVTVTGAGQYKGTLTATYSVIPPTVTLTKLTNLTGRKLEVTWNAVSPCQGYQLQYATNSGFKNAKSVTVSGRTNVTRTLTGLTKGKKYYVRIRAYKVADGVTYRGRWSAVKSKKIRK